MVFFSCTYTLEETTAYTDKSERTIKTITVNLTEKGIIERKKDKRNGFWEIKTNHRLDPQE